MAREKWGYPKTPLIVLSLVALIDQVDVNILRGVLPLLEKEFDLNDLQLGLLGFAFVFVNVIATIPAGWVADRYNRTKIIGWTLLSWSALSGMAALAFNYVSLFAARAALGIGQAVDDPSSTSLLTDHYPASVRGRVFSAQQISVFVGGGIGLGIGGLVGAALGWRWAFVLVGMPGSLIALWCFRLREPKRGEADGISFDQEKPFGQTVGIGGFAREAWTSLVGEMKFIFGIRTMRYVLVGVGTLLFTVSGVGYWLAVYHDRYSDMTLAEATGATAVIFTIAGIVGTLWGGSVADKVYGAGPGGRIRQVSTAILVCGASFLVSFNVPVVPVRLAFQFAGVLAISSALPGLRASMMDVVPAQSRGVSASAFALTSTVFGTALAPPLVGLLSDVTGSLVVAFYIVTPPIVIGSLILRRAQHTIVEDAQQIVTSMMERQQAEQARLEVDVRDPDPAADPAPDPATP